MRDTTKMKFYTGAWLYKSKILVVGYDNGHRFVDTIRYKPYMFVESKTGNTGWKTIKGKPVERMDFPNIHEKREFYKSYNKVSGFNLYGLTNDLYTYLNDAWEGEQIDYDVSLIKALNIDIEVAADEGFPSIEDATKPVTAVTMKMINDDKIYVLGCGEYENNNENVTYVKCETEAHLLRKFIDIWKALDPDVVTGWNVEMFDVPYMVNRITNILGFDDAQEMSPFGIINDRRFVVSRTDGTEAVRPDIIGVTILDYLVMYRKFTYVQQESYRLDNIASVELGEKKLDYSEYDGLLGLYKNNYQKFIDYNIKDVQIVDRLEEKMGLITLAMTMAYRGGVNYSETFGTVQIWDSILYRLLFKQQIACPPKLTKQKVPYPGAYVKEPQTGMHDWVVSFDLNSLYPMIIVQYNMSPETVLDGKQHLGLEPVDKLLGGEEIEIPKGTTMAASGVKFSKDQVGIIPAIIKQYYDERRVIKTKMLEAKQAYEKTPTKRLENEMTILENQQMSIKILMNSLYGALGNKHFRYFNNHVAEAITTSGQLSIRWAEEAINKEMNAALDTLGKDYVIAIDTDSLYVNMNELVKKFNPKDPVVFLDKICREHFEKVLEKAYAVLAKKMNVMENRMEMAREVIANRGVWIAKKRYILNVHNNEGVQYAEPKMKMMGVDAVRSSTPQVCRDKFKKIFKVIIDEGETATQKFIADFKKEFRQLPPEAVSFPRGCNIVKNGITWADPKTIYRKACPIHVRGALLYNHYIKEKGLDKKYELVNNGEKIKFCYLKTPNPIKENIIGYTNDLPKELDLHRFIDYNKQYEKAFVEPIKHLLDALEWDVEPVATLEDFFS